jgi:hypothetical protein
MERCCGNVGTRLCDSDGGFHRREDPLAVNRRPQAAKGYVLLGQAKSYLKVPFRQRLENQADFFKRNG